MRSSAAVAKGCSARLPAAPKRRPCAWRRSKPRRESGAGKSQRITVSLDGIGEAHTVNRGRENFFEKTTRTLDTVKRMRAKMSLSYAIRAKTVVMRQNHHDVANVARFAARNGMEVFYQAVEQTYDTPEDSSWATGSLPTVSLPTGRVQFAGRLATLE